MKPFEKQTDGTWQHPELNVRAYPLKTHSTIHRGNETSIELRSKWLLVSEDCPLKIVHDLNEAHGWVAVNMHHAGYDPGEFYWLDDEPRYFKGYATGQTWNGWQMPVFPYESVCEILDEQECHGDMTRDRLKWRGDTVVLNESEALGCEPCDDCTTIIKPEYIWVEDDKAERVWAVGAGFWTWMVRDEV